MKALELLETRKNIIITRMNGVCSEDMTREEKAEMNLLSAELAMVCTAIEEIESLTKQLNEETEEHMKACRMCYEHEKTIAETPERRILDNLKPFLLQHGIVVDVNNPDSYFDAYEECRHDFGNLL